MSFVCSLRVLCGPFDGTVSMPKRSTNDTKVVYNICFFKILYFYCRRFNLPVTIMKKLEALLLGILLLNMLHAQITTAKSTQQRPNVILIYVDDLGYGDLSCYGATKIQTPFLDKLASNGIRFTNGHSTSATCTPSRYAMIELASIPGEERNRRATRRRGIDYPSGYIHAAVVVSKSRIQNRYRW